MSLQKYERKLCEAYLAEAVAILAARIGKPRGWSKGRTTFEVRGYMHELLEEYFVRVVPSPKEVVRVVPPAKEIVAVGA